MSELLDDYHKQLRIAARLEGLIDAHRLLKGDDGDANDVLLWRLAADTIAQTGDADD